MKNLFWALTALAVVIYGWVIINYAIDRSESGWSAVLLGIYGTLCVLMGIAAAVLTLVDEMKK